MANKRRWRRIERIMGDYHKLPKQYSTKFRKDYTKYLKKQSNRMFEVRHGRYVDDLFIKVVVQEGKRIEKCERVLITGDSYCHALGDRHATILEIERKNYDGTYDVKVIGTDEPYTYRQTVLSTDIKKLK